MALCECGCGYQASTTKGPGLNTCKCGCGQPTHRTWAKGHYQKSKTPVNTQHGWNMEYLRRRRQFVSDTKSLNGCAVCGEKNSVVLDLHHVDPSMKEDTVNRLIATGKGYNRLAAEMEKCIVLCANHHRMVEAGQIDCPDVGIVIPNPPRIYDR